MASDPSKHDQIWKNLCEKEFLTWQSPEKLLKSLQMPLSPPEEGGPFYRVPVPGDVVTISGIRRRPELNGSRGEIVSDTPDEFGRVTVSVFEDPAGARRRMKIQPHRLVPCSSAPALATMRLQDDRSSIRSLSRRGSAASRGSRALGTAISCSAKNALSNTGSGSRNV
mmetsp:Transcript_35108/g.80883  ORF Transcript_35108/g.80883 Transcript_35108/m.80883 type:complete len:168 (-) Transcript_35108:96-599(-)